MSEKYKKIAFQGMRGAYSDVACQSVYPDLKTIPCHAFEDAFEAVCAGDADLAMIPVDNTIAGRVADVHHLMPASELFIIREHFQPIRHALLGIPGTAIDDLKYVHSHVHAIPQCKSFIRGQKLESHVHADTAGAAADVAERGNKTHGAIASALAAELYGLDILKEDVQDAQHNTTRFVVMAPEPEIPPLEDAINTITTLIFEVRNIPAALYKCLGGFATNGLSFSKLESYVGADFQGARFYCDIEGHPDSTSFKLALEELGFYAKDVQFLGAYPAHHFRQRSEK